MAPKRINFIGFGDLHGTKAYKFIDPGGIHGTKAYIGFGDIHGHKAYKFIGLVTFMAPKRINL